jgi:hypothetical protein
METIGLDPTVFLNYGALGAMCLYFIFRDAKQNAKLVTVLESLEKTILIVREKIDGCNKREGV